MRARPGGGRARQRHGGAGGFGYRSTYPGLADPVRPKFVVNTIPTRTPRNYDHGRLDPLERSSSYVDTFTLGSLDPGRTATFRWNVTAVKAGSYRICYRVNAGLDGKAKAVPASAGQPISGVFAGTIAGRPPQAHIAQDGKTVVQGMAVRRKPPVGAYVGGRLLGRERLARLVPRAARDRQARIARVLRLGARALAQRELRPARVADHELVHAVVAEAGGRSAHTSSIGGGLGSATNGYRGRRGAMIRYALSPSPRRSRSSDAVGSRPVSSRTRSRR